MTATTTTLRLLGLSNDLRTNRWEVKCPACGNSFVPKTTMFARESLDCPARRCGAEIDVHYMGTPPTATLIPGADGKAPS